MSGRRLTALGCLLACLLGQPGRGQSVPSSVAVDCEALSATDPVEADRVARRILTDSQQPAHTQLAARLCLITSLLRIGDNRQAGVEADRVLDLIAGTQPPPALTAAALRRTGAVAYTLGEPSVAITRYMEALAIVREQRLVDEEIALLINLGTVLSDLSDYARAHRSFDEAQALIERAQRPQFRAQLLVNYGRSLANYGDPTRALPLFEQALQQAESEGHRVGVAHASHGVGRAYRLLGRLDEAEAMLQRALAERRAIGAHAGESATLLELAHVRRGLGRSDEAIAQAERAVTLAAETADEPSEREGQALLSELYAAAGRVEEGLRAARRHAQMQAAYLREQNQERIAEIEGRQRKLLDERELELLRRDNQIQALQLRNDRLLRRVGLVLLVLTVIAAIAATWHLRRINRRLRRSNATDELTGLSNRRYLSNVLDWARGAYGDSPQSGPVRQSVLFLIDIDHFKSINDRFGHEGGDRVLRILGQRLRSTCRSEDKVGRWGGEEFLVAASHLSSDQAAAVAERLRKVLSGSPVELPDGRHLTITASVGFAPWPFFAGAGMHAWQEALRLADRALYAAKAGGRDAWVGLWGETPPPQGGMEWVRQQPGPAQQAGWILILASTTPVWLPVTQLGADAESIPPNASPQPAA